MRPPSHKLVLRKLCPLLHSRHLLAFVSYYVGLIVDHSGSCWILRNACESLRARLCNRAWRTASTELHCHMVPLHRLHMMFASGQHVQSTSSSYRGIKVVTSLAMTVMLPRLANLSSAQRRMCESPTTCIASFSAYLQRTMHVSCCSFVERLAGLPLG